MMSNRKGAVPELSGRRRWWAAYRGLPRPQRLRIAGSLVYLVLLTLLFSRPLTRLVTYAAHSDLFSYVLLVPFVAAYLLWIQGKPAPAAYQTSITGAVTTGALGLAALAAVVASRGSLSTNDELAVTVLAFVCLVAAGGFLILGARWMAGAAFATAFLIFLVPLPDAAVNWLEGVSALASADAAALFYRLAGTPFVRRGTVFELPGISLEVGQECSGIHSSWVLFITSVVASHLFLKSSWRRLVLVAFVIPLGIVRNGFRILVVGLLCVHLGPQMIDGPIHRRGGPLFFLLSLLPLFLLLWWFRRREPHVLAAPNPGADRPGGQ